MEHGAHPVPGPGDLLFPAINFIIFGYLIVKYASGPIGEYFRARTQQLREALAAGAKAKREAEALRAQLAKDMQDLPALRARLSAELHTHAEQQRDRMLAQATSAAERIRRDATIQSEQELAAARHTLRQEVIDRAVDQASRLVRAGMGADDQQRFVRDFVAHAGGAR